MILRISQSTWTTNGSRGEDMKMIKKILKLFNRAMETVARKLPAYPVDPLYPWIIIWLILPLLLSLSEVM